MLAEGGDCFLLGANELVIMSTLCRERLNTLPQQAIVCFKDLE